MIDIKNIKNAKEIGMDTSKYQEGKVDFSSAVKAGYNFVFLRIGYNKTKDAYFESDYTKAKAAGMRVGCYYYTINLKESDGVTDAKRVLGWLNGKKLDMPIAYDMEENSMKKTSRKDLNSKQYNAFSNTIRANGYVPILYTGESMFNTYFNSALITDHLWIAKYGVNDGKYNGLPKIGRDIAIHQYTSASISTDFYNKKLDRNIMLVDYDVLMGKTTSLNNKPQVLSINKFTPLKGNPAHFAEIIKNIKLALNTDYGLAFTIDSGINDILLVNLANVVLSTSAYKPNITYALQQLFVWWGYDLKLDGIYGNGTKSTVTLFQSQVGIPQTGTTTKEFWYKILGK